MKNINFEKLTPMMKQYVETKKEYPDSILMYRLGDFYEMFFEDAILASKVLDIVLTGRDAGQEEKVPMCGVPFHAADNYINKLVSGGHKVAICEQLEDPKEAKGIVKRGVTRVITPGTNLQYSELDKGASYLASIFSSSSKSSLSYIDFSTGNLYFSFYDLPFNKAEILKNQLSILEIKELLINDEDLDVYDLVSNKNILLNLRQIDNIDSLLFNEFISKLELTDQIKSLFDNEIVVKLSLFQLFDYLRETQFDQISHIRRIHFVDFNTFMTLDKHTLFSLDVFSENEKKVEGTLFHLIDKTKTAMGSRKLRYFLEHPLISKKEIQNRLDLVENFNNDFSLLDNIRQILADIYDIERVMVRISGNSNSPKDLLQLKASLRGLNDLYNLLFSIDTDILGDIGLLRSLDNIYKKIDSAIIDDAPLSAKEGGLIKDGFSNDLDQLKSSSINSKTWILDYERELKEETSINKLKIKYNKILGYFIEISNSYLKQVPDYFIRKQTLVNSERFFTDKLKNTEMLILNSKDKINSLEYEIYQEIRNEILNNYDLILNVADLIANIDVFSNFSFIANRYDYTKPIITDDYKLFIQKGRHPIVEQNVNIFIDNDTLIDNEKNFIILTGPNMAGKSTYMRQLALISIMMQIGSFVPASYAQLPVFDRIFTRIGAHDNLYMGESTFMVEMKEMSDIISNSTKDSLIILDEVGRGTSTYDGLSLAKALIEYIISEIGAKTIFATHFHELIYLEEKYSTIKNQTMEVSEKDGEIKFLRKVIDGSSDKSYGIHVARLAGIKNSIIYKAKKYLSEYEDNFLPIKQISFVQEDSDQLSVDDYYTKNLEKDFNKLKEEISTVDINSITPLEAMIKLNELNKMVKDLDDK